MVGDGPGHTLEWEPSEELQDGDVLPRAGAWAEAALEVGAKGGEGGRERPVAVHRGVVEGRRLLLQRHQEVQRIEDTLAAPVAPPVGGDHVVVGDDLDAVDEPADGDPAEGVPARHAVPVGVERDRLVLVHLPGVDDAGVERPGGSGSGGGEVVGEALCDGLSSGPGGAVASRDAAPSQVGVQLVEVLDPRHGRGPHPLEVLHAILDAGLFLGRGGHAELGCEGVVRGERGVPRVEGTLAAAEDVDGDRGGVVPPQFAGDAAEEVEGRDEAVEDGLGPLGGEGEGEGRVGVAPGDDEDGDEPSPVGEVDVDVAEVGLGAVAGGVVEGDEGLACGVATVLEVALDGVVAAGVPVLGDEPSVDLGGGVPLLAWCGPVGVEDGIDGGLEGSEDGCGAWSGEGVRLGLGVGQSLANRVAADAESAGDLSGTDAVPVEAADLGEVVHGTHPNPPRPGETAGRGGCATGGPEFGAKVDLD